MLGERRAESERSYVAPTVRDARTLAVNPKPRGDTQINRDGLDKDMSYPQIRLGYWPHGIANNMLSV